MSIQEPPPINNRNTQELRAILTGEKPVTPAELKAMAIYGVERALEQRDHIQNCPVSPYVPRTHNAPGELKIAY